MGTVKPVYPNRSGTLRLLRTRLFAHLSLARISNSPTVLSNVLSGAALAGGLKADPTIFFLMVAMVFFYSAGMYLNDLCDFDIDCRERPERPLPTGALSRRSAAGGVAAFFGTGIALLASVGRAPLASGLVLVAMIVAYDLRHKNNPFAPFIMAGCRLMVYITAYLAFAYKPSTLLIFSGGLLAAYLWGLTYIARFENRRRLVSYLPAAALLLPAAGFFAFTPSAEMAIPVSIFILWVFYCLSFVYRSGRKDIGGAIGRLIAGISLVDGLVLTAAGAASMVPAAFIAFGLTLLLQRHIRGT